MAPRNPPSDRLAQIPGFSIDEVADAAGDDPDVLRLENLDTDLKPPTAAIEETQATIGDYESNSYLPFIGHVSLREAVCNRLNDQTGNGYTTNNALITAGGTEGMLDILLAILNSGDEVVLTDPTYAGMINRVRLADGMPEFVPFVIEDGEWRLDIDELRTTVSDRTRMLFIMNPSMPSGAVLTRDEWAAIAEMCTEHDCWLLYNAAMERIVFDDREVIHPASLPGMADRTLTVGSVSKEYRMIGWRVGWVVGPAEILDHVARTHIYNVVTPPGIPQVGAEAALKHDTALSECIETWEARRDIVTAELSEHDIIPAAGGWSQLLNVENLGYDAETASTRLLDRGNVAATPMTAWGEQNSDQFIRLVFSNEPVERLEDLGSRVDSAL